MSAHRLRSSIRIVAQLGFSLVELISVMVLLGILSAIAIPRLSDTSVFQEAGFHEQVLAALRIAQKSAVARRRLVCATISSNEVRLTMASSFPASACIAGNFLRSSDGNDAYAHVPASTISAAALPYSILFFQPSGRVTSDGSGNNPEQFSITIGDQPVISVYGHTGHVK